ncbi:MAG: Spy/CpxP family protein refolding chaperone [Candidatus Binatia bacterium]
MITARRLFLVAAISVTTCVPVWGGPPSREGGVVGGLGHPAFLEHLFRPELVMRYQTDIALTPEQRDVINQAIRETQQQLLSLRWQFEEKSEEAAKLFAAEQIDSEAAMAKAIAVMDVEEQVKQAHLRLLIRVKNALTPGQQEQLRQLRPSRGGRHRQE